MARGDLERRADGGWILRGAPPEERPGTVSEASHMLPFQRVRA
jgi:hypothetical protein